MISVFRADKSPKGMRCQLMIRRLNGVWVCVAGVRVGGGQGRGGAREGELQEEEEQFKQLKNMQMRKYNLWKSFALILFEKFQWIIFCLLFKLNHMAVTHTFWIPIMIN